jgi:hypothetical protein
VIDSQRRRSYVGEPHKGNDNRSKRRSAADEPHDRASTPPARGPTPDNN